MVGMRDRLITRKGLQTAPVGRRGFEKPYCMTFIHHGTI
jgi:hypothetical protein